MPFFLVVKLPLFSSSFFIGFILSALNPVKVIHRPDKRCKAKPSGFGHFLFAKQNDIQPCAYGRDSIQVRQNLMACQRPK